MYEKLLVYAVGSMILTWFLLSWPGMEHANLGLRSPEASWHCQKQALQSYGDNYQDYKAGRHPSAHWSLYRLQIYLFMGLNITLKETTQYLLEEYSVI